MVPAEKLPDPSRATMVLPVGLGVAVVAELATLPAVAIVASLVSPIPAVSEISSLVIVLLAMTPSLPPETLFIVASDPRPEMSALVSVTAPVRPETEDTEPPACH